MLKEIHNDSGGAGDLERSAELFDEVGDRYGEAWAKAWRSKALVRRDGLPCRAKENLDEALVEFEAQGDVHARAWVEANLGSMYYELALEHPGCLSQAMDHGNRALELSRQVGNRHEQAWILNDLGNIYREEAKSNRVEYDMAKLDEAIKRYKEAVALFRQIRDRDGEARTFTNLGATRRDRGDFKAAILDHQSAVALHQEVVDPAGVREALKALARTYRAQADHYDAIGDQHNKAKTLMLLGETLWLVEEVASALNAWRAALEAFGDSDVPEVAEILRRIREVNP